MEATLKDCLNRHGSDKATRHHYHLVYEPILAPLRFEEVTLLEVGVDKGASLRAWREWFPNALITGIDIYKRAPLRDIPGVAQIKANSTNPPDLGRFDIIIDDGCHFLRTQAATLKALWPMLNPGGTYFIEDVSKPDRNHEWTPPHNPGYHPRNYRHLEREIEMTGADMEVYDQRGLSGKSDSCIYVLRKP